MTIVRLALPLSRAVRYYDCPDGFFIVGKSLCMKRRDMEFSHQAGPHSSDLVVAGAFEIFPGLGPHVIGDDVMVTPVRELEIQVLA